MQGCPSSLNTQKSRQLVLREGGPSTEMGSGPAGGTDPAQEGRGGLRARDAAAGGAAGVSGSTLGTLLAHEARQRAVWSPAAPRARRGHSAWLPSPPPPMTSEHSLHLRLVGGLAGCPSPEAGRASRGAGGIKVGTGWRLGTLAGPHLLLPAEGGWWSQATSQ